MFRRKKEDKDENVRHLAFRFRIFPNEEQKTQIKKTVGSARFIRNFYLEERKEVYKETGKTLTVTDFNNAVNKLKQHSYFSWLKEVDKFALTNAIMNVNDAFDRFFKGQNKFPKRKKKHESKQSYTTNITNGNIKILWDENEVQLPKLGKVKTSIPQKQKKLFQQNGLPGVIKTATISSHSSGQFHVSILVEQPKCESCKPHISLIPEEEIIAADLGLTHFLINSNGEKIENPRYLRQNEKKLAKLQRKLKNMVIGSSNFKKLQKKIAKLHLHIAHMRKDFLHKQSRKLVNENQVIILEDLNVKNMIKNKKLAKSIADVGWGMFKTFVSYKADWDNKHAVFVDTFFPSSKLCSGCNEKHTLLSLSEREWVCPNCGTKHDRDANAAINIKREGIRILKAAS